MGDNKMSQRDASLYRVVLGVVMILAVIPFSGLSGIASAGSTPGDRGGIMDNPHPGILAANNWTNMNPSTYPGARQYHAMAYDSESDRVILFGG